MMIIMFRQGTDVLPFLHITHKETNYTITGNIPDPISLNIILAQVYEFTIYLTLADGHEMVYWTGGLNHTTSTVTSLCTQTGV